MERVTIGKLRNQLSAYLRKVRAGETVIVCDRNTPVAQLMPLRDLDGEDRLARLAEEGVIRIPDEPWRPETLSREPQRSKSSIVATVREDRDDGW